MDCVTFEFSGCHITISNTRIQILTSIVYKDSFHSLYSWHHPTHILDFLFNTTYTLCSWFLAKAYTLYL